MDRQVGAARRHVIEDCGFLFLPDAPNVGVDHEAVVLGQVPGVEFLHVLGVVEVYAAGPEGLLELGAAQGGAVVPLVTEEEQANGLSFRLGGQGGSRNEESGGYEEENANSLHVFEKGWKGEWVGLHKRKLSRKSRLKYGSTASIGKMKVTIDADGSWLVKR